VERGGGERQRARPGAPARSGPRRAGARGGGVPTGPACRAIPGAGRHCRAMEDDSTRPRRSPRCSIWPARSTSTATRCCGGRGFPGHSSRGSRRSRSWPRRSGSCGGTRPRGGASYRGGRTR
jgi:hypothetical protein